MNTKKAKHTPGPWAADDLEDGGVFVFEKGGGNLTIADLNADRSFGFEQIQANARLIAAAPELLAALETISESVNSKNHSTKNIYDTFAAIADTARAAIAAAKGDK